MNRREFLEKLDGRGGRDRGSADGRIRSWRRCLQSRSASRSARSRSSTRAPTVLDTLAEVGAHQHALPRDIHLRPRHRRAPAARQPLPDHGKQEYDDNFHGGNFATPHPQYYREHQHHAREGARSSATTTCIADVLPARAQARHEGDLLVRGRLPARTCPASTRRCEVDVHGQPPRPRLLPQSRTR